MLCVIRSKMSALMHQCMSQVCKQQDVPVILEAPALNAADSWEGMFITSTSRLVLPVDSVELPDGRVLRFSSNPLIYRLQKGVADAIRDRSEKCL